MLMEFKGLLKHGRVNIYDIFKSIKDVGRRVYNNIYRVRKLRGGYLARV